MPKTPSMRLRSQAPWSVVARQTRANSLLTLLAPTIHKTYTYSDWCGNWFGEPCKHYQCEYDPDLISWKIVFRDGGYEWRF